MGRYPITVSPGSLAAVSSRLPRPFDGTLPSARRSLTVVAANKYRRQGAANPALTYTIKGFVNSDKKTVVRGKPRLRTTAVKTRPAGMYPIIVSLGRLSASNYDFTLVNGTLTVTGGKAGIWGPRQQGARPSPFDRLIPTWWRKGLSRS